VAISWLRGAVFRPVAVAVDRGSWIVALVLKWLSEAVGSWLNGAPWLMADGLNWLNHFWKWLVATCFVLQASWLNSSWLNSSWSWLSGSWFRGFVSWLSGIVASSKCFVAN
jgi:hypothetical protein